MRQQVRPGRANAEAARFSPVHRRSAGSRGKAESGDRWERLSTPAPGSSSLVVIAPVATRAGQRTSTRLLASRRYPPTTKRNSSSERTTRRFQSVAISFLLSGQKGCTCAEDAGTPVRTRSASTTQTTEGAQLDGHDSCLTARLIKISRRLLNEKPHAT